jgi:hypothetical protein
MEYWVGAKVLLDQHHMIARIVTMIGEYRTLLKQHNCNLNMCDLDKIGLGKHDLESRCDIDD